MAKRFTDTAKWKDTWFQDLPNKYKLFWVYMLDDCDSAGLWKPNVRLASFQIGEHFEESELKRIFNDRITVTEKGYWFIRKFIEFQYGELSDKSKPHISVMNILRLNNIEYSKGIHTLKEKEKEKDEEKEQDKEVILGTGKNYFVVTKKYMAIPAYRVQGVDGLNEYFQIFKSQVNYPDHVHKFMRDRNGKNFKDFDHVWNDFDKYVKDQFK